MRLYARQAADPVVRAVDAADCKRMLDVGGGTGTLAMAFAQRWPGLRAVVFDRNEQALAIGREDAEAAGLHERVTFRQGDMFTDDPGAGYDLALLSSVVCLLGDEDNARLLRRVKSCLSPGGRIVIKDAMVGPSGAGPAGAAIFSVHMLVNTERGRAHPCADVECWLREAGFHDLRRVPLSGDQVIIAKA